MKSQLRHAALTAAPDLVLSSKTMLRASVAATGSGLQVDEAAGIIRNAAVMKIGEARGHGFVIDATTLKQVEALGNAVTGGVKVRFQHPTPDADGMLPDDLGDVIGYVDNFKVVGDALRGDVHLEDYAAVLPGLGDVRTYLLRRAKSRPETFGLSCVIGFDTEPVLDSLGNVTALVARVQELDAVDVVGRGAATPDGLLAAKPTPPAAPPAIPPTSLTQTKPAAPAKAVAALTPKGRSPMTPQMKQYLCANHGLAADATDETAQAMFDGLSADDQTKCKAAMAEPEKVDPAKAALRTQLITDDGDRLLALESKRVTQIRQLGDLLKPEPHIISLCIASNDTVLDAKKRILDHLAEKAKPIGGTEPGSVRVGPDKKIAALQQALPDAIMLRAGKQKFYQVDARGRAKRDADGNVKTREAHELAERYSSLTVLDMYRRWLVAYGAPADEVAEMSRSSLCDILGPRKLRRKFPQVAQLAQSSSDFDNILLDAQNKTMMLGYVEAPRTWNVWAKRGTAPDFKNINRINISEVPTPTSRKEGGPIKYVTITDSKETYTLTEYASGVILTRITLLNDDMNALQDIPMRQGQSCARLEDDVAYAILTANAAMADTGNLFNSTAYTVTGTGHQNLVTVTASIGAPTVATVSGTEKLVMLQKGPQAAAILNLTPKFWIGPVALKTTAEQFFASRVDPSKYNDTPNPYNGRIVPVSNARLDANSSVIWYLMADYRDGQIDTIEVCFLQDEPEPVLKQETDFDTDDQKYAVRHVVAAKALDFRGMAYNPGA